MHPAARTSLLLVATTMATASAPLWAAGDAAGQFVEVTDLDRTLDVARDALVRLQRWIAVGYATRPAVMLGLGGAFVLPVLVLAGFLLYRRQSTVEIKAEAPPGNLHAARIEIEGVRTIEWRGARQLLQIGRQDDNDICIKDETVSRYHAVIEHTGDSGFTITDVSSPDGFGLRINGERMLRAVLSDGDMVELGRARMKFAATL